MYNINDLKEHKISPKGAIFKLLDYNAGKNGRAVGPSISVIPARDTIFVPQSELKEFKGTSKEGKDLIEVLIQYFTSQPRIVKDPDSGENVLRGVEGEIVFRNGYIRLEAKDMRLYNFLSYCNLNKGNEFRLERTKMLFEEEIPNRKIQDAYELRKKKTAAINLAESMEEPDLIEYAASLGIHDTDIEIVLARMTSLAETEPEMFTKGYDSGDRYIKALVNNALEHKVIENINNTGEWNHIMPNGTKIPIIKSPKGKDQKEWFIEWLAKDNRGTDREIQSWIDEKTGKKVAAKK